jgi:hypothetical protein
MTTIAEFSDYAVQSIEYFIDAIESGLETRDIAGLTNDKIEIIKVTKEHPLVMLMASQLNANINLEALRSSIIPAISVTPGNMSEEAVTFGKTYRPFQVDDDWIAEFTELRNKTDKEIQAEVLITKNQIESILTEYRRGTGIMRCQKNMWGWNEEINISAWSSSPDLDILLGTLLDSILAKISVGMMGDDSPMKNLKYRITKGLTNFNFGRVLFGTEYNLTFFNSYHNYTIFTEDYITGHDLHGTFKVPGSTETWSPTE